MSKAFTREDDARPEQPEWIERVNTLPAGARNYLTPGGAARLSKELIDLMEIERPSLTKAEDPASKHRLALLDRRIEELQASLQSAEVVAPPPEPHDRVRFGATVTVRDRSGEESRYRIVGADETDLDRDWVSWMSPIAKALLNARLGERVRFKFPSGETELEVVGIEYEFD